MKVALTTNNYPPEFHGGTERVVAALAHGLMAKGDEVIVIAGTEVSDSAFLGGGEGDEDSVREERDGDIKVFRLPLAIDEGYGLSVSRPRLLGEIRKLLVSEGVEVVHLNHWSHLSDGQVRMVRELGLGCVVTLHDMWTTCPRFFRLPPEGFVCPTDHTRDECARCANVDLGESEDWVKAGFRTRDEALDAELRAAHAIVAPSQDCADACLEHHDWDGDDPKIQVLPHGLLDTSSPAPRGPLGLPLRIGTFGNLNREKGIMVLVEAMAGVRAELHLHGAVRDDAVHQEFVREVTARAEELDVHLTWHGGYESSSPHPALSLDLAVFPSLCRETYGLVIDEALHHGTPVIAADSGALRERLEAGGGLIVPPGDVTALHQGISAMVQDRDAYHLLRAAIPVEIPTIDDTVAAYRHLYAKAWAAAQMHR